MVKLSVDQTLFKANSHAKKGEVSEAKKLYETILQKFPKNKRAQKGLTTLRIPQKKNDNPSPLQEKINQILKLYNQGQLSKIVEQSKILTDQYPESIQVWNILGVVNNGLGRVVEASEAFKKLSR